MATTYDSYRLLTRNLDRTLKLKATEPIVALETKYFQETIPKIKSIDDFIKNTRVFNYAMKAFGLEEMSHAKAYMRKVLTEGIVDEKSFANRLNDERFTAFAKAFDFDSYGALTTSRAAARQDVVDKYVRQSLEVDAGTENEGVRLALYFKREAPKITSAFGLMADPALWKVVKTVYGFPAEMGNADIDRQAAAVKKRLDIASLKEPAKLDRLIQRFTARWDVDQVASDSTVLTLFNSGGYGTVGSGVAMSLLTLRYGG
ncbi:DUF1217 domain-containing protein [Ancylobacter radicis]|uniref:DUF1217 domain-containing protein n=1 Tax=Ancylobacter radicis TaxID=2836179 RepID=A0ABS5RCA7_9HYPH|nr:DUF1217 domain-containing protein [Ancylobacter radicis]MBS9479305.1 DUF1217 domain-containing protein [Ancylobacter radicis]